MKGMIINLSLNALLQTPARYIVSYFSGIIVCSATITVSFHCQGRTADRPIDHGSACLLNKASAPWLCHVLQPEMESKAALNKVLQPAVYHLCTKHTCRLCVHVAFQVHPVILPASDVLCLLVKCEILALCSCEHGETGQLLEN